MAQARCPSCRKQLPPVVEGQPWPRNFPFCSDRCRTVDLGRWLQEEYRVPVKAEEDEDGDGLPGQAGVHDA